MAHRRQLKCVIIVRISQTHKYNDLRLSKLPATNEINRVPSEFEIIWNGGWWEMIHLSCYLRNSNIEIYPPTLVHSHCSLHPVEFVRALWALPPSSTFADRPPLGLARLGSARRWVGAADVVYLGRHPSHNIFPRNTDVFKGQVDTDLTE